MKNMLVRQIIALVVAFLYVILIRWFVMTEKLDSLKWGWRVLITVIVATIVMAIIITIGILTGLITWKN